MWRYSDADASRHAGLPPAWILLDTNVYINDWQNATSATTWTSTGQPIQVTLVAGEPPHASYFCVSCPCLNKRREHPEVVNSEADLAVLRVTVGDSLRLRTWTHKPLVFVPEPDVDRLFGPTKVIALGGGGELGWVDLQRCILVCDVLSHDDDDSPTHRIIPLPKLLNCNQPEPEKHYCRWPRQYSDVSVRADDGSITCVEIEHHLRLYEPPDVAAVDVLHDSQLPVGTDANRLPYKYEYHGWRIITWNRAANCNYWRKVGLVHVDEIPWHAASMLLPVGYYPGQRFVADHLTVVGPTVSIHGGDDVVYIKCNPAGGADFWPRWMLAIDMARKTILQVAPISAQESHRRYSPTSYISCALSKYLITD
ncbi:hypothetical protein PR202_gb18810 [Eleusine coracana subsp. coracana]|uniref:DUF1618 domain-containing protein n=1 Tax=Eleusine coracana subsp. coracana TaxID=191504 RepID=A0AAV5F6C1_ELECO|nr:hypothetical protein QOZ80_3BG0291650 [Eleusine coracana subsp. coracana]GJN30501.1 hypothetical protein PR202_gb18810 [Eleusine coracana subsp. coracana]